MCNYTCAPNYGDCDGDKSNGCEVFLGNDVNNCGACNNTCVNSLNQEWICEISDNTGLGKENILFLNFRETLSFKTL
eukprot:m.81484 g.81484  ORF g.81484 m.81484 type:complete len:77 (-) comp12814_c0_seq9:585-815(-)